MTKIDMLRLNLLKVRYNKFYLIVLIGLLFACGQREELDDMPDDKEDEPENVFYIDSQSTFDEFQNFVFPAGSSVLFASGEVFKGQFVLRGRGTAETPNYAGAYDPVSMEVQKEWLENKPVIEGEGKVSSVILLENGGNWEINNLEVTNNDGSTRDHGNIFGIHVTAEDVGVVKNVTIKNCYVHHVNGEIGGKETGGIRVDVLGDRVLTKFEGVTIEGNHVAHVGGVGIANQSSFGSMNTSTYNPWSDLLIKGNRVEYTGRNGIIVRYAKNPVVEYNVVAYSSRFDTGHNIFNFNTTNCIVQYNECYGNTSDNPNDKDRGGFDADYNSTGTVIQYNYSHDNNWFCGIMRKGINTDVTIRYNISQNELQGAILYGFPSENGLRDVKIYNNTFYFGKDKGQQVFVSAGKTRIPIESTFSNNIFFFEDSANWGFEPASSCEFQNNLYFNVSIRGTNAVSGDPLFVAPGTGGIDIDMTDPNRLKGYKLMSNSPAIAVGIGISNDGDKDFTGQPIPTVPNIGAFQ
jgi:hypothetical protein